MRDPRLRLRSGRGLPAVGIVVGVWALGAPYVGPQLGVAPRVELVDHVVPGLCVVALSMFALTRAARRSPPTMFVIGLAVALAGAWVTATHVSLLARASRHEVSQLAAVHHALPGLAVVCVGAAWALTHGSAGGGEPS